MFIKKDQTWQETVHQINYTSVLSEMLHYSSMLATEIFLERLWASDGDINVMREIELTLYFLFESNVFFLFFYLIFFMFSPTSIMWWKVKICKPI